MKRHRPSKLELQVLSLLWDRGPSTAREVLGAMPDGKERAYTSILSVMQVMEKKGLLTHTRKGNANVYSPAVQRGQTLDPVLKDMVDHVFGGKPSAMMQQLLENKKIDPEELSEIRRLLDEWDKGGQN